jgi:hypothetical protein
VGCLGLPGVARVVLPHVPLPRSLNLRARQHAGASPVGFWWYPAAGVWSHGVPVSLWLLQMPLATAFQLLRLAFQDSGRVHVDYGFQEHGFQGPDTLRCYGCSGGLLMHGCCLNVCVQ